MPYLAFHEEFEKNVTMNCSQLKLETFNASPSMKQINEWLLNRLWDTVRKVIKGY